MAAEVTHYEIDSSEGVTTVDVRTIRWPGQMYSPNDSPDANDLPADIAEALLVWLESRDDQKERIVVPGSENEE